jgi:hypothetical protein
MNLISVGTVTRLGFEFIFEFDHCQLSKAGKTIITAMRNGSLYLVNQTKIND